MPIPGPVNLAQKIKEVPKVIGPDGLVVEEGDREWTY